MINTKHLKNSKYLKIIHGELPTGEFQVCTDSRNYKSGELFYAINGEKFDGFDYIDGVIEKKCPLVVFESNEKNLKKLEELNSKATCFIEVENSLEYLHDMGRTRREEFKSDGGVIIGITGSNGKTSHKEMMKDLLESAFPGVIHSTKGNLNNHIGVPLTLLDLEKKHQICILEMGTNHPGEIPFLCELSDHDHGLITNIGASHLEFFHTEESVFNEKRALFDHVEKKNNNFFVVPGNDTFLSTLSGQTLSKTTFNKSDSKVEFEVMGSVFEFENAKLGGDYNYSNMVTCLSLLCLIYPEKMENFLVAASSYRLPEMNRANWVTKNNFTIFLDAYNANPSSMKASLEYFDQYVQCKDLSKNNALIVLGDMNELGEKSAEYHLEIGKILKEIQFENLVFVGKFANHYKRGAGVGKVCGKVDELVVKDLKLENITHVFIKGSRSLQLESLIDIF
jgi:UDP-N-acetylmuramoyl-tripeptide--D-alanyl-D-alanine ligase